MSESRKSRVAVFAPFNFAPAFLSIGLEFLQREIDAGNEVYYISCLKGFKSCGFNTYRLKYMCEICVERHRKGVMLINGDFHQVKFLDIISTDDRKYADRVISPLKTIDKDLVVDGFDVGESVHSSFISKTKEKTFSRDEDIDILKELALQSMIIYSAMKRFLVESQIDRLILFNGRWDYYRAAMSAGKSLGKTVTVLEHLRWGGYYEMFENVFPHDLKAKNALISNHWDSEMDLKMKEGIAREFFQRKREGLAVVDKSYTAQQKKGHIPGYIDPDKKLIVIYNSSDYEFEAVGKEYNNPYFKDQATTIMHVAELVSHRPEFQLVIRMHPNLTGLQRDFLEPVYALSGRYSNVFVIRPEDIVDSYALMDQAFRVCTFVSTMGIESTYWGKTVVMLGKSLYSTSGVAHEPGSVDEISKMLFNPLEPKSRETAEKFAYYYLTGGRKGKYYDSISAGKFLFKGVHIYKLSWWFRLKYRLLKLFNVKN